MAVYRLIYRSRATGAIDKALLADIEQASSSSNEAAGVTGILVASKERFLQVLEGERASVSRVFQRISGDPRHDEIELLSFELVEERCFEDWAMKGVNVGLLGRILGAKLKRKYGELDGALVIPADAQLAFALLVDLAFFLRGGDEE